MGRRRVVLRGRERLEEVWRVKRGMNEDGWRKGGGLKERGMRMIGRVEG